MLVAGECQSETQGRAKLMCAAHVTEAARHDGTKLWSPCWTITREGLVTYGSSQESQGFTTNTVCPRKTSISQDEGQCTALRAADGIPGGV